MLELAQFYEHAFGRVPVRDLTRAWFMSVLHLYQRPYARYTKRTSDIVGALILLVLSAPLFPVLALARALHARARCCCARPASASTASFS